MSETESQSEPTMEEILASIRRIISEEETEEAEAAEQEGASEAGGQEEDAEVEAEAPPEPAEEGTEEPAAEPAEAAGEEPAAAVEEEPVAAAEDEDVLELTEKVEEAAPAPPAESPPADDLLVSEATAAAAASSLSNVMGAISHSSQRGVAIGGGRTLEEVVRDALQPVLKEWLDANLAGLVERIVREEIKKMVRRAEEQ